MGPPALSVADAAGRGTLKEHRSDAAGTPAAKMPQVDGAAIKDRARRLRLKGEEALRRHLEGEIGRKRQILAEAGGIGRTEQFTQVRLGAPVARGAMLEVMIASHNGRQLVAA